MSERERIAADIAAKREKLAGSIGELEHKFDVKAQRKILSERMTASYQGNPVPWWIGVGVLGVAVISTIAWAVFGDD
ncbi:MAG: hypothetical protein RJA31_263 [Actinomycetota bacterium]|jgi:hypothetical protein